TATMRVPAGAGKRETAREEDRTSAAPASPQLPEVGRGARPGAPGPAPWLVVAAVGPAASGAARASVVGRFRGSSLVTAARVVTVLWGARANQGWRRAQLVRRTQAASWASRGRLVAEVATAGMAVRVAGGRALRSCTWALRRP